MVQQKIDRTKDVLRIVLKNSANGMIGERDLRRILFENLDSCSDYHVDTIVAQLKTTTHIDKDNYFRRFDIKEAIEELDKIALYGMEA